MFSSTVKNKQKLIQNGKTRWYTQARELLITLFEQGLDAVNPAAAVKDHVLLDENQLFIKQNEDGTGAVIKNIGNVYVVGGGKAAASMAMALEEIFGDKVKGGAINVPGALLEEGQFHSERIEATGAGHPIPDEAGVDGVQKMLGFAKYVMEHDLVFCVISGGASALMPFPAGDISLDDKQALNRLLIDSGATITEINTVRKHVSSIKGGWLAQVFQPAQVIGLIMSDVVGDDLATIGSGPTVPDPTTFQDAVGILTNHNLMNVIPSSVRAYLLAGVNGEVPDTPKPGDRLFDNVVNVLIGSARMAANAITIGATKARPDVRGIVVSDRLEGEASVLGRGLHSLVEQLLDGKGTFQIETDAGFFADKTVKVKYAPPSSPQKLTLLVFTGELTVTIKGNGIGGRNQEMLASFLDCPVEKVGKHFAILSCAMDGIEGNSTATGAIIDDQTKQRCTLLQVDLAGTLENNDSNAVFVALDDAIVTGATGASVNDITMVLLEKVVDKLEIG
jgi:glycerate-2-kinase